VEGGVGDERNGGRRSGSMTPDWLRRYSQYQQATPFTPTLCISFVNFKQATMASTFYFDT